MLDPSDRPLLDLLRREGPLTVAEMSRALMVTPTAIRNRLARLASSGLIDRRAEPVGRGRPRHAYRASATAHKQFGQNYADLAAALWDGLMHSVADPRLRRTLFGRVADRLADAYRDQLRGDEWQGRMVQLGTILHDQGIEAEVAGAGGPLPILRQHSCPYHELAEADPTICAMERKMLEKVVGRALRLSQCRLDGHRSCDFEPKPVLVPDGA